MEQQRSAAVGLTTVVAAAAVLALWATGRGPLSTAQPLVVYCAHDSVYSDAILQAFQQETGIPLEIRYDTEATKSLGLVRLIQQEREQPQCDVFWNNELLGTISLQAEGLLVPYQGTGWQRMPEQFRDPDGEWVGFGARLRVWIVNTDQMPADEAAIEQRLAEQTGRVSMARPMFGTTLTHYSVLAREWGLEELQTWHRDLRQRGLREVTGNATSKDVVSAGTCDCGWTDTDDVFVAFEAGASVKQLPIRVNGRTIAIPNSVAIIKGCQKIDAARKLVDYLASAETELRLSRSTARQIPLGEIDDKLLSDQVRELREWARDSVSLRDLLPVRQTVLDWLKTEYAP